MHSNISMEAVKKETKDSGAEGAAPFDHSQGGGGSSDPATFLYRMLEVA
jgi:hypothetical protein